MRSGFFPPVATKLLQLGVGAGQTAIFTTLLNSLKAATASLGRTKTKQRDC